MQIRKKWLNQLKYFFQTFLRILFSIFLLANPIKLKITVPNEHGQSQRKIFETSVAVPDPL